MQRTNATKGNVYEVDLIHLFRVVWSKKWFVAIITFAFTVVAAAYAYMLSPVYESKLYIPPPTLDDISSLNHGRTEDLALKKVTVDQVFKVFVGELQSQEMRQYFFQNVYLPGLVNDSSREAERSYGAFSQNVIVGPADKEGGGRWSVAIRGSSPASITNWMNLYVEEAAQRAEREVLIRSNKEISGLALDVQSKISQLRESGERERQDTIIRLNEALLIAQEIGLENPFVPTGPGSSKLLAEISGGLPYIRGKKVLQAQLKVVADRKSNDPFISGLRNLQIKYDSYQNLKNKEYQVSVFDESAVIQQPVVLIKPRKVFILLLGIIFGGITGLVIAIVRGMKQSSKKLD